MRETSQGMFAAEETGVVHRDLKPANILIDTKEVARVTDFGIARDPAPLTNFTSTGELLGTAHYMAPEQAEDAHVVDSRADIYSFGATYYHALVGKPPFEGGNAFSVLYKHKTEPVISPRSRRSEISQRTNDILERCLAKSPADRFSSFGEILQQLDSASNTQSPWMITEDPAFAPYFSQYESKRSDYLSPAPNVDREIDYFTFPRGQTLRIFHGDIVKQQVNALVSSEICYLYMDGGVSLALSRAGGPDIERQARRYASVRPGRAVVTTAGSLPARFVFHGVTVGFIEDKVVRPSRDLIIEIMASCFYHADSLNVQSIAFPLLGTGGQGFPRDVCLDTMFQFLSKAFLYGLTCVRDARIVIFSEPRTTQ
jgi:O-acetyl-ADP-ribose deacetylase (regulator of RNase III)